LLLGIGARRTGGSIELVRRAPLARIRPITPRLRLHDRKIRRAHNGTIVARTRTAETATAALVIGREDVDQRFRPGFPGFEVVRA
jgi:hypothetical protein